MISGQLDFKLIKINKQEAARYLGYKKNIVDGETNALIDECFEELKKISELKYVYNIFDIIKDKDNDNIRFIGSQIEINSNDLIKRFKDSNKAAAMAVTLGFETEKKIRYYSLSNLAKAVVFDACAASYIESFCDYIENEIAKQADTEGKYITKRFSPGYGDVSIIHQQSILDSLNAQKLIGLTVSDSYILIPRKSVTAFIGINEHAHAYDSAHCLNCNLHEDCIYEKDGKENA